LRHADALRRFGSGPCIPAGNSAAYAEFSVGSSPGLSRTSVVRKHCNLSTTLRKHHKTYVSCPHPHLGSLTPRARIGSGKQRVACGWLASIPEDVHIGRLEGVARMLHVRHRPSLRPDRAPDRTERAVRSNGRPSESRQQPQTKPTVAALASC
jgi:hypothetical protein